MAAPSVSQHSQTWAAAAPTPKTRHSRENIAPCGTIFEGYPGDMWNQVLGRRAVPVSQWALHALPAAFLLVEGARWFGGLY